MAKKPQTYWQKRFEIYEARSNLKSQSHIKSLQREYNAAKKAVENDLKVFYNRLAANNDLPDHVAAKKLLNKNELADFKMSLKQYTQMAKENGITGDFTKQLENASLKHRISRLEAIKLQLEQKATMLMHSEKTGLEKFAKSAYENAYYNGGFEIAKGTGLGKSLFQLDDKKINTVIHKPWAKDGKNFSERVWGQHRPQLVNNLHRSLTDSLTRGTGPDKAIAAISHDFDVSMSAAARLVQTEESYFTSVAQKDVFNDLDVEQYEIIATLDSHTSDICQDLDGKVFKMSEYEAGVTAPPFHVRCRTTTAPYFDDEIDATRAARDPETGQTVQVPADMKYEDWKDQYIIDPETGKTNAQLKAEQKAKAKAEAEAKAKAETEANKKTIDELDEKVYKIPFGKKPAYMVEDYAPDVDMDNVEWPETESITLAEASKYSKALDVLQKKVHYGSSIGVMDKKTAAETLSNIQEIKNDAAKYNKAMNALGGKYKSPTTLAKEAAEAEAAKKAAEEAAAKAAKKAEAVAKAKATKAAKAAKLKEAQAQIVQIQDKEFNGIWKDTVTPADYAVKKDAIAAKHAYFDTQIAAGKDVEKFTKLKADLDDFEFYGAKYQTLQAEIDSLKPKPRTKKIKLDPNAYSKERKDAAYFFERFKDADNYFDPLAKKVHAAATKVEHRGFYTYTSGSGGHNRPLAGFRKPWRAPSENYGWDEKYFVGPKKVNIDFEGKGAEIRGLTDLINKSSYSADVWVQSGQNFSTLEGFLGIPYDTIENMTDAQLQAFVGRSNRIYCFLSTAVNKGDGSIFNSKPMKLNIYLPRGSKALYASDVGAFGKGENEMILQRGASYDITRIYWGIDKTDGNRRKLFVDMEVHPERGYDLFQQDPKEWTGDMTNYMD